MQTVNIEDLKSKINKVKQTIDDVKNFKNIKIGSRLIWKDSWSNCGVGEYIFTFVGTGYVLVNLGEHGGYWSFPIENRDDAITGIINLEYDGTFRLVGDPLISDLEKELKDLKDQLEEALNPKDLKCSDAPDGWYVISGKTFDGLWANKSIQKGDVVFIKNGIVFMKDHGKFSDSHDQNEYCIEGLRKSAWYGYLVEKLP